MNGSTPFDLHLDQPSSALLAGATADAILLGVIHCSAGTVRLFHTGSDGFAGHRELLQAGMVQLEATLGFSVHVLSRQVRAFYRTSVFNRGEEDFAISRDMMNRVLAALNLPLAANFRSYP